MLPLDIQAAEVTVAPGLAATAVFCFIFSWSDFFYALILTRTRPGSRRATASIRSQPPAPLGPTRRSGVTAPPSRS